MSHTTTHQATHLLNINIGVQKTLERQKTMRLTVKADKEQLDDGAHIGTITEIKYTTTPYEYVDIIINDVDRKGQQIKVGYPQFLAPSSALGLFLERMGQKLEVGKEVELETLIGTPVSFTTSQKKSKDGKKYARVIPETVIKRDL